MTMRTGRGRFVVGLATGVVLAGGAAMLGMQQQDQQRQGGQRQPGQAQQGQPQDGQGQPGRAGRLQDRVLGAGFDAYRLTQSADGRTAYLWEIDRASGALTFVSSATAGAPATQDADERGG